MAKKPTNKELNEILAQEQRTRRVLGDTAKGLAADLETAKAEVQRFKAHLACIEGGIKSVRDSIGFYIEVKYGEDKDAAPSKKDSEFCRVLETICDDLFDIDGIADQ